MDRRTREALAAALLEAEREYRAAQLEVTRRGDDESRRRYARAVEVCRGLEAQVRWQRRSS